MKTSRVALLFLLAASLGWAQTPPAAGSSATASGVEAAANTSGKARKPNKALAYYHYSLAHIYEELVALYGRTEYANKAIEEYRLAIENDPASNYLDSGLAELYAKTGRTRDAVLEAQDILKRNPDNLDARKLLGRIYLRSLGNMQAGSQPTEVLKRAIEQYEQVVRLEPNSVENHLLLGRLYRLNNDIKTAETEFKTAVGLEPNSEEAVATLAYLYNEQGDPERAVQVLNSVPEDNRTDKLYMALGYTYEQQKEYKKAIEAYQHAVDADSDNLDALRGLAQNLLNDGQNDAALQQYKTIVSAEPQDPQSHMRMAEIYRRQGKLDQALEALSQAENYVQDSFEVPYNKAIIYQAQGRFDDAVQILQSLVERTDQTDEESSAGERNNRAVFLERLGGIYRDQNKTQLALETFRKITTLGDDNAARGYQELIETYRNAKQYGQALTTAQEAVDKLPHDRSLKIILAAQLADSGRPETGLTQVRELLKGTPEDREIYVALGQMNVRLRRWKDAEDALSKAKELSTKQEELNYVAFLQGALYERSKRFDEAETIFRKIVTDDPDNAMVLNYLGYMMADRGVRLEEALGFVKKAVELDPQNGAYLDSLGWAYFKLGNYQLAEEHLLRASERIANDPAIQDHLAELFAKTGRLKLAAAHWELAIDQWNKSVPADVDPSDVERVQKKLESAKVRLAKQQGEKKADATKP